MIRAVFVRWAMCFCVVIVALFGRSGPWWCDLLLVLSGAFFLLDALVSRVGARREIEGGALKNEDGESANLPPAPSDFQLTKRGQDVRGRLQKRHS